MSLAKKKKKTVANQKSCWSQQKTVFQKGVSSCVGKLLITDQLPEGTDWSSHQNL